MNPIAEGPGSRTFCQSLSFHHRSNGFPWVDTIFFPLLVFVETATHRLTELCSKHLEPLWVTSILSLEREVELALWRHILSYLIDIATAGKSIACVIYLASASPFVFSGLIADRKFTTASIFLVKVWGNQRPERLIGQASLCWDVFLVLLSSSN